MLLCVQILNLFRSYARVMILMLLFSALDFQVKDHRTGVTLVRGLQRNDVYVWPTSVLVPSALTAKTTSTSLWHARLGHPSPKVLRHFLARSDCSLPNSTFSLPCTSCKLLRVISYLLLVIVYLLQLLCSCYPPMYGPLLLLHLID